jgi:hypothetical protein
MCRRFLSRKGVNGHVVWLALLLAAPAHAATTYEVGPGKALANVGDVPWEALNAGDTVLIYARPTPYREKWVISRAGTASAPITVRGVADAGGNLPVISGDGATTRLQLDYTNESRGVIKIGTASPDVLPQYIVLESLDVRSARPGYTFTDDTGMAGVAYNANAASIYVERGQHITIRNCTIHDSGNGLFVGIFNGDTQDVLVDGNYLYDNGNVGSAFEHNNYTAAVGIVFQRNHFGPLRPGCDGNNLKDRSIGTVIRYNWIESGNRQLDLVDAEDDPALTSDPRYRTTFVYGNVLIEPDGAGNSQIVHYGGDSGDTSIYRKGVLHFYDNTVVSTRSGNTTLLRLSTNEETADVRDNVVYVTASGDHLAMLDADGALELRRNWLKTGFVSSHGALTGTITTPVSNVVGAAPGFVDEAGQDFHLTAGSPARDVATGLNPAVLPANDVVRQYVKHQSDEARPSDGAPDVGAFELAAGSPAPGTTPTATPTPTRTATPSRTPTPTRTATQTRTVTPAASATPGVTATSGATATAAGTPSAAPSGTPSAPPTPIPVAGKHLLLKDRPGDATKRVLTLTLKDARIDTTPATGIDPVAGGATLQVYAASGTGDSVCLTLPASGWSARGVAARPRYRYRDGAFAQGPCRTATVQNGKLLSVACTAKLEPIAYSLDEASQGAVAVRFSSGGTSWCALFGGRVRRDSGTDPPNAGGRGQFDATDAPAPATCPPPPDACP